MLENDKKKPARVLFETIKIKAVLADKPGRFDLICYYDKVGLTLQPISFKCRRNFLKF
jgi:hypothetical protein